MRNLGSFPGGDYYAVAYGINTAGHVVGYDYTANFGASHAFLYSNDQMIDLNTLISPTLAGWLLTVAYGINDAEQNCRKRGSFHSWPKSRFFVSRTAL